MEKEKNELQLENLKMSMEALKKPFLSNIQKRTIKNSLIEKIDLNLGKELSEELGIFSSLILSIKKLTTSFNIDRITKALVKEKILEAAENHSQKTFFWSNFFSIFKKLSAATLILTLIFGVFSFWNMETQIVRASSFTSLYEFNGQVSIERNGQKLSLKNGMKILKNDRIYTGKNGTAVIKYLDDSISRLANNTDILIKELSQSKNNGIQTYVEIFLSDGAVWSKVINLLETDSTFVVKTRNGLATAQKAAFNVEIDQNKLKVGVYNHAVNVAANANSETERIVSGEKITVNEKNETNVQPIKESEKKAEWVQGNLASDRQYIQKIDEQKLLAKVEAIGTKPEEALSSDTSLKEDTLLLLTFDDLKKQKIKLDISEKDFMAAQIKLHDTNLSAEEKQKAEELMATFTTEVKNTYKLAEEVSKTNPSLGTELRSYVDTKLSLQKKDLSVTLPDSPAYSAKKIIDELELLTAKDGSELAEIKTDQAAEKLAVAEEVKNLGNEELAAEVVDEYKEDITGIINLLEEIEESEVKEELLEKVTQDIDLLENIEITKPSIEVNIIVELKEPKTQTTRSKTPKQEVAKEYPEPEKTIDGPYGLTIQGDKVLPPLFD